MKLGKEEIQKIFLGVLLFIGLLYGYFDMLLGPLQTKRTQSQQRIADLTKQLTAAKGQIRRTQELEDSVPAAEKIMGEVKAMVPEGAPVAWFPPRVADQFQRPAVDKPATRMMGEQADKEIPGFRWMSWSVDFARVDFGQFARALADFENNEPLVEVSTIQIEASHEDVEAQRVALNIRNIVTQ